MPISAEEEDAPQGQKRTGDGIEQVLQGAANGLRCPVVEHQRHGQQGDHLEEEVHGDKVPGKIHAHQRRQGQQEETEEFVVVFLVFQIAEGIDAGEQEAEGGNGHEQPGNAVHPQGDGQAVRHGEEDNLLLRAQQHHRRQHRLRRQSSGGETVLVLLAMYKGKCDSCQRRKQNQDQHHGLTHLSEKFQSLLQHADQRGSEDARRQIQNAEADGCGGEGRLRLCDHAG